jgi:hypothetical protein
MRELIEKELLSYIKEGEPIRNVRVAERVSLTSICGAGQLYHPVEITGCRLVSFDAMMIQFHQGVLLENSLISESHGSFAGSYFLGGLRIQNCIFESDVDFQCGVHNKGDNLFALRNTVFKKFVNFFDCRFEGPVEIKNCRFEAGTNLLGNRGAPFEVTFETPPIIKDNFGDIELSGG